MMNKETITEIANSIIKSHLPQDWSFGWNRRKRAIGVCNFTKKKIFLSEYFINRIPSDEMKNTILHEIAHAIAFVRHDHRGHGLPWKLACREIGAKPDRVYCGEVLDQQFVYTIKCPKCENALGKHRMRKKTLEKLRYAECFYRCSRCSARMDVFKGGEKIIDATKIKKIADVVDGFLMG